MKRTRLIIAAVIPSLLVVVLFAAYWLRADVTSLYLPGDPAPAYYNEIHFTLGRGQLRAITSMWRPPTAMAFQPKPGLGLRGGVRRETASLERALLDFDFSFGRHPMSMVSVNVVAVPTWCLWLPCLLVTWRTVRRVRPKRRQPSQPDTTAAEQPIPDPPPPGQPAMT